MERLSALEFAAWRHLLGLSFDEIASLLNVTFRTIQKWESGEANIPYRVAEELSELNRDHIKLATVMANSDSPIVISYKKASFIGEKYPRGWYVAALSRALQIEPSIMAEWDYD